MSIFNQFFLGVSAYKVDFCYLATLFLPIILIKVSPMETKRDIRTKPYKVLIVDDDELLVKMLERILFKRNYLFFSVTSGEMALEAIYEITPDIILLDVLMANMDGYEVCMKLKKTKGFEQIPVIFLTSNTAVDEIVKGFKAGAVDYIVKPFNTSELIARLEIHLELKRSREAIKEMDFIKTKFFSVMTNDIKNSIIGLRGVANFLLQELSDVKSEHNEALKLSRLMVNDSSELYLLLESLIEWASIELGQKKIVYKEIDIRTCLHDVIKQFDPEIQNKSLNVELTCSENIYKRLPANYLEAIMQGLISNAVKFSHNGGRILIEHSFDSVGNQDVFTITDNGVGMSEDIAENFFSMDMPIPKTRGTQNEKGTGIGLIICKALVDRLDGAIALTSSKNKGTKVTFNLPVSLVN